VIAHGEIDYRSNLATRGQFLSTGDFVAVASTNIYGSVSSQRSVFFNGSTTVTAVPTGDTTAPTLTVALTNDSGSSTTDRLTKDAGISGQVSDSGGIAEFTVKLNGGTAIDLRSKVQTNGTFNLTDLQLRQLVGTLADGSHSLAFSAKDTAGNISTFALNFVLDSTAPQLTLPTPGIIKNDGKLVGQLVESNLAQLSYQWDNGTAKAITVTNGSFNQALDFTGIANGTHQLTVTALDQAGNLTVTPYSVMVDRDLVAPIVSTRLGTDSGTSNSDGITNNPAAW
jgi:large repetitive protein